MHVVVSGSSGLIGSALVPFLQARGYRVNRLVRSEAAANGDIFWDPAKGRLDAGRLEGADAVVHLAGESIAAHRWNKIQKERILKSRSEGTWALCEVLSRLKRPPRVLVSASAVGYYGNRPPEEELSESSLPGAGFVAEVCHAWEEATNAAAKRAVRVVRLRIGIVLSRMGGALGKMLTPFSWGLGGPVGGGRQIMSWIAMDDLISAVDFALSNDSLSGAVNATAPNPVTNAEFAHALGRALGRPAFLPLPGFAVRLIFGEMGQELLLSGARVVPAKLLKAGFNFQYPELGGALKHVLG